MLDIYARSFMTATRINPAVQLDARSKPKPKRRWLPKGHWWLRRMPVPEQDKR